MDKEGFKNYLVNVKHLSPKAASDYAARVGRIEKATNGNLDTQNPDEIMESIDKIHINGDTKKGIASLKAAHRAYKEFRG